MIIGDGDIGSVLPDRKDFIFFAAGVSNSQEEREDEYNREFDLLLEQDQHKHIVYFSTLAIFYGSSRYVRHKLELETHIKNNFGAYTIIRLGNITWGDNPHTLLNFIKNKIRNYEPYEVKDEYRYLIDKKEFLHWINLIPEWSCEMNLPGRMMKVSEIAKELEKEIIEERKSQKVDYT